MAQAAQNHPLSGFGYLLRGLRWLARKELRPYVVIPLLVNILLFSLFLAACIYGFSLFTAWVHQVLPSWLDWLSYLLWLFFALSYLLIFVYTFTLLANIIAAPFNGFLAEKVECLLVGKAIDGDFSWRELWAEVPRTLKREWHKLWYYLPRALGLLILFLVPVVNIVAGALWLLFNAWMMYLQYVDYPIDNHKISFIDMRRQLRQHKLLGLSFGGSVMALSLVPILNFFIMPAAVIGATQLWVERFRQLQGGF